MVVRIGILALAVAGLVALSAAAAEDGVKKGKAAVVREIELKGFWGSLPKRVASKPLHISSADELTKAIPDEEVRDQIAKQVDFAKDQLVIFSWVGSGTDKLTYQVEEGEKGPVVVFTFTRGHGDDLPRPRHRLYAVAKGANWGVEVEQ
jgi:ABC-type molybdate transport system substrate-binding protein